MDLKGIDFISILAHIFHFKLESFKSIHVTELILKGRAYTEPFKVQNRKYYFLPS